MAEATQRLNAALEGRYRVERQLGEGGMATVYLADDLKHERKVALKVLRPELAAVVGAERFLAEIKTTANLQHPHILPLHDSGEADGFLYYVMPYVQGESLRARLDRETQLAVDEAVAIATNMAEALDYAHRQGVIHRDIKPANVLLQDGKPLIADFGIALAVSAGGRGRLTETGLSLGTPFYMSPEQATGDRHVGPASDVYALGCVLYETLVGEPPFTGVTPQAVLSQIIMGEADRVTQHRRTVPPNVEAVIDCALELVPADRFGSAGAFAAALGDSSFRHGRATPESKRALWNPLSAALAVTTVGLVVWIALSAGGEAPDEGGRRYRMGLGSQPALPVDYGAGVAVSRDGMQIAYVGLGDESRIVVKQRDELEGRPLEGLGRARQPAFSPDGSRLAAQTGGTSMSIVSLETGSVAAVADSGVWLGGIEWTEDGWIYVQASTGAVRRHREEGGRAEDVTRLAEGEVEHLFPHVLPDGSGLLFTVWHRSPDLDGAVIAVQQGEPGGHRVLTPGNMAWYLETGRIVVLRPDGTLLAAPFDLDLLELSGALVPVLDGTTVGPFAAADLDVSPAGVVAFTAQEAAGRKDLVWVDRQGVEEPVDVDWQDDFESVEIAPGGDRIAVTTGVETNTTIWLKALSGGPPTRFTFEEGLNRRPVWSADGSHIYFISDRDGRRRLYRKAADGTGAVELVLEHDRDVDQATTIAPSGWMAFRVGVSGQERDIYAVNLETGETREVAAQPGVDEIAPMLSPDGRFIAYTTDSLVWFRPFPDTEGGRWQVSPGLGDEPRWSPDGSTLYFRGRSDLVAARVRAASTFAVQALDTLFNERNYEWYGVHASYDVAPQGERFLMLRYQEADVRELIVIEGFDREVERRTSR